MAEKEYIERGALIAEIDENFHKTDPSGEEQIGFLNCRRIIREHDAADVVEVKHGKWNYNPDGMDWGLGAWECSLCGCANRNLPMEENIKPLRWAGTKYCPNCGAKMDGGAK